MLQPASDFCRLLLLRHPELVAEDDGRAIGAGAGRVGRRGQRTVLRWLELLQQFSLDAVYSSAQPQCADPAAALCAAKGLEPLVDDRLRDQELGEWQGRSWEEIAQSEPDRMRDFFTDFGEVPAPAGESLGMAVERMLEWWAEVRGGLVGSNVAVVASGAMISGLVAAMLGMRLSRAVCLQLPPGGLGVVDVYANGIRVSGWNPDALRPPEA